MPEISSLLERIEAEFSTLKDRVKAAQDAHLHDYQEREKRLATLDQQLSELQAVWKPRLDAFVQQFGERVEVTPRVTAAGREATFEFDSELASIRMRLSASTDQDVRNLILEYHLEIIPVLMKFDSHKEAEWPIDAINKEEVASWIDDRLVDFVRTYVSLHENGYYLKDHMVEDPVANVRFPKFAAGAKLDWQGKTYYFVSPDTQKKFAAEHGIVQV
jgi:YHS domain-containing protein